MKNKLAEVNDKRRALYIVDKKDIERITLGDYSEDCKIKLEARLFRYCFKNGKFYKEEKRNEIPQQA